MEALIKTPQNTSNTQLTTSNDHGWIYWSERMQERQKQYLEVKQGQSNYLELSFSDTITLNFIGDIHAGAPQTDYRRIEREVEAIVNTPNSYILMLGDVIDGMFWNPGQMEQIEQVPEQAEYMTALLGYLSRHNKLIAAFVGDHDGWAKKTGADVYAAFMARYQAYLFQGVSYITINVGGQAYHITAAHRLPGHSQYNKTHGQNRAEKFGGARGSDIVVSGHTHQKGYSQQGHTEFGGIGKKVHYISVGPYKSTDEYAKKLGFNRQTAEEMYGSAVRLYGKSKQIMYYDDVLLANDATQAHLI